MRMPALFLGHGSPMNIILKNAFTDRLKKLGEELPRPRAILVISAHWLTDGTYVTCMPKPRTIHDFYGFPDELYAMKYSSPGSPDDAKKVTELAPNQSINCDYKWGLDHASWAVLKHMYPRADIPVIEMSLDYSPYNSWYPQSLRSYYDLGKRFAPLRDDGVLIIGSGNIVHNLRVIDMDVDAKPYEWAIEFDNRVKRHLVERNHSELLDCQNMDRVTSLSVPTLDHYLPMVCALSLQNKDDRLEFIYEGFQNGSVSMRCFKIG